MKRAHWHVVMGLLGALILTGVCVLLGWERSPKPTKRVSLQASGNDPTSPPPQADKLRIAVGAIISPAKSLIFYEDIFDYIEEKLGKEVQMVQRKTYGDVNIHMEEGRIDAAFVCSRPYVRGHRDFGMELLCVPMCLGKTVYQSYFIVHKDSPIQKLEGLRDKVFAFSDPLSNTGRLVPVYTLAKKMGERPESFFRDYVYTYSHDNSIRRVAEKTVHGAAVDSLIWEYENRTDDQWTKRTKIIYRSPSYAIPPVVVSPNIDPQLRDKLRSAFVEMHLDPKGRAILKKLLIDRFTTIEDGEYDSIRQMEAFMKAFRSRK